MEFHSVLLQNHVGTHYGDLKGLISLDGHSFKELYQLCEDNGIKRDDYFLIGFGFSEFTTDGIGRKDEIMVSVLLLDKTVYPDNFDEIKEQIRQNSKVTAIKKSFTVKYSDLYRYIKRFDAMMLTGMGSHIDELVIIDE